ncbi:type VI secretion system baseplate subunit TssG [soil metagenome]
MSPAAEFFARLADKPWNFGFYAVMRKLETLHPQQPRFGEAAKPADESIRLAQPPAMDFAPAELSRLSFDPKGGAPKLDVRFFGLFGPQGPLPLHLTEYARERLLERDASFASFANMFHHRLLLLFYRAWAQAQPTVQLDRPDSDRFAAFTGSLIGFGAPQTQARGGAPDHLRLHFAGRFASQVRNAEGLQAILGRYFKVPVRLHQFIGQWLQLPASERSRLQRWPTPGQQLGVGLVLGSRVWDAQHKFRIAIGPLPLATFESFLARNSKLAELNAIVADYLNHMLDWDLDLSLHAAEVPTLRLGGRERLGRTSWLQAAEQPRQRAATVRIAPQRLLHAPPPGVTNE